MSAPLKIHVILASTREKRFGDKLARYLFDELSKRNDVEAELVDLRDWPLPFFDAPTAPALTKEPSSHEIVNRWAAKIREADGYLVVTPEYNHGYPAVLKNAIDWLFHEWAKKPIAFASYGNAGGARAIEQLREVVIEVELVPLRDAIHLPLDVYLAVRNEAVPANPEFFKPIRETWGVDRVAKVFDAIVAYANALRPLRG